MKILESIKFSHAQGRVLLHKPEINLFIHLEIEIQAYLDS